MSEPSVDFSEVQHLDFKTPCTSDICVAHHPPAEWVMVVVPPCGCTGSTLICEPCRYEVVMADEWVEVLTRYCRKCEKRSRGKGSDHTLIYPIAQWGAR